MSATAVALTSQEKQAALADRVRELEKELMELEDWKSEAERYQLAELFPDVSISTPSQQVTVPASAA